MHEPQVKDKYGPGNSKEQAVGTPPEATTLLLTTNDPTPIPINAHARQTTEQAALSAER